MRSFIGFSFSCLFHRGFYLQYGVWVMCDVICEYHYIPKFCPGWDVSGWSLDGSEVYCSYYLLGIFVWSILWIDMGFTGEGNILCWDTYLLIYLLKSR